MITIIIMIYLCLSLIVMSVVKPWNDEPDNPMGPILICLLIGGGILIFATIQITCERIKESFTDRR